jgi:hypothetical protein
MEYGALWYFAALEGSFVPRRVLVEGGALVRVPGALRILLGRHGALAPDEGCACAAPTRVPTANFGDTNPPTRLPRTLAPNAADPTGKSNLRAMHFQ